MQYRVTRPGAGAPVGQVMSENDFIRPERIKQLLAQRYIAPLQETTQAIGLQPTSELLKLSTINRLRELVTLVVDAGVLEAAMLLDTREGAKKVYELRLGELRQAQLRQAQLQEAN